MDRKVLNDYVDACAFIKEAEKEIRRLKRNRKRVVDKVRGSNPEFPYQPQSFGIAGVTETVADEDLLRSEEHILDTQRKLAEELKLQVEEWMAKIPFRMQRIIRYRFFNNLSWEEVALLMRCKSGGESIRIEFYRFMRKK